jgi:Cu/Zn superoxide dismutase
MFGNNISHSASFLPLFSSFRLSSFIALIGKSHGAPSDSQRMVGDLGNLEADASGVARVDCKDTSISLVGPHSILGRSLVIFAGEDDQGRGGHEQSLKTGNSGPRIAAGVIGIAPTALTMAATSSS